jgi:hypothetical protein
MGDELHPLVRRRDLPSQVAHARSREKAIQQRNDAVLNPRIDAHLSAYSAALDELAAAHGAVADQTDLDLVAESQPAATWAICGRSISLGMAVVSLLRADFAMDAIPLIRSLHETNRLLEALGARNADGLVVDWLTDARWVGHKRVLAVQDASETEMRTEMIRAGIKPPPATLSASRAFYERLSEFAHNRRRHVLDAVSPVLRHMPLGAHPDARVRAAVVGSAGPFIAETVTVGGFALARVLGREWFVERFNPRFHELQELQRRIPLDPETLGAQRRRASGAS